MSIFPTIKNKNFNKNGSILKKLINVASQALHAIMGAQLRKVSLNFPMHRRGGEAVEEKQSQTTLLACAAEHKNLPKAD